MKSANQAIENVEYVRRLLKQAQPEFAATLELAADLVGLELGSPKTSRTSAFLQDHDQEHRVLPPAEKYM